MEQVHHPHTEAQNAGPIGKAEKLPVGKLHSAQYLVALILVILLSGLWRLQVLNSESFRSLAEANRVRKVPILAPRGKLFDREGRLLVDNYPSVSCYLLREQVKDLDADLPLISKGLHIPVEQIQATIRRFQIAPKYQPIPLKQDITPDEQAFMAAHRDELRRIWALVEALPHQQRTALVLKFQEDMKIEDIAVAMGKSAGAVKLLIHRGVTKLRDEASTLRPVD